MCFCTYLESHKHCDMCNAHPLQREIYEKSCIYSHDRGSLRLPMTLYYEHEFATELKTWHHWLAEKTQNSSPTVCGKVLQSYAWRTAGMYDSAKSRMPMTDWQCALKAVLQGFFMPCT